MYHVKWKSRNTQVYDAGECEYEYECKCEDESKLMLVLVLIFHSHYKIHIIYVTIVNESYRLTYTRALSMCIFSTQFFFWKKEKSKTRDTVCLHLLIRSFVHSFICLFVRSLAHLRMMVSIFTFFRCCLFVGSLTICTLYNYETGTMSWRFLLFHHPQYVLIKLWIHLYTHSHCTAIVLIVWWCCCYWWWCFLLLTSKLKSQIFGMSTLIKQVRVKYGWLLDKVSKSISSVFFVFFLWTSLVFASLSSFIH